MMEKGYTQEEVFKVLFESEQDRKRRWMQAIVTETVDAHRLQKMRDLLAFEKLATWRRMMVLVELWKARKIGFMVIVRFRLLRSNTLLV